MGRIKDVREALIADLGVIDVPILDDWLVRAEPPCILVKQPSSGTYVSAGKEFTSYVLNLDVVVMVEEGPECRDELERLVEAVLRNTADWALDGVNSPATSMIADSTVEFLSTAMHLQKGFYL